MAEDKKTEDEGVVIRPNLENYTTGKSASGKKTHHTGDHVATAMDGMTVEEVAGIGAQLIPDAGSATALIERYSNLNVGMQRMNIGNRIRAVVAKLEKEEAGKGTAAFDKASGTAVKARNKRVAAAAKEAEAKAKEKAKAAKEKAAKENAKAKADAKKNAA